MRDLCERASGVLIAMLFLASCSSEGKAGPGHDAAVADSGADAAVVDVAVLDAGADAGPGETVSRPIWTVDSRGISVGCFGFFQGSMSFTASRDQLPEEQLALLQQMTRSSAGGQCISDGMGCDITVTEADGSSTGYRAEEFDAVCGGGPLPANRIAFTSFAPVLQTIHCLYAKGVPFGQDTTPVAPDVRCSNGLFTAGPGTLDRVLSVADPGVPHHLDLKGCGYVGREAEKLHLQLFAEGATSPLAQGAVVPASGADGACVRLDHTFAAAGKYRMNVVVDPGFTAGDFYFKFY